MSMTTLRQRAERHGLVRSAWEQQPELGVWEGSTGHPYVWWNADVHPRIEWRWGPPEMPAEHCPRYKSEDAALAGALGWLDAQHPERAWAPPPGGKLGEAVRRLRRSVPYLQGRHGELENVYADCLEALHLLEALALPPASDEGQVLAVAWDFALQRGGLPESGRAALVAAVRHHPEVVAAAKLAGPWIETNDGDWFLCPFPASSRIAEICPRGDGRWSWHAWHDDDRDSSGVVADLEAAREAVARALPEWRILEAPAASSAPAPVPEVEARGPRVTGRHAWQNVGTNWDRCRHAGCQRHRIKRTGGVEYCDAATLEEAAAAWRAERTDTRAGRCPGRREG